MAKLMDLTGQQFGRWTVIERAKNGKQGQVHWLCRCSCGTECIVVSQSLRTGHSQSCGCLSRELSSKRHLIDLVGQRFGRWTVQARAENNKWGNPCWLCQCDCGERDVVVIGKCLRDGRSQSCGCLNRMVASLQLKRNPITPSGVLPSGKANFNRFFYRRKHDAKRRGLEWGLTKGEVYSLTQQDCHYCGVEPQQICKGRGYNGDFIYNGLDRFDNTKGYISGNVVPCCGTCNKAKLDTPPDEFKAWVCRVYEHYANLQIPRGK